MVPAQIWGLKQGHELRIWIAVHTCTKQQRNMVLPQRDISCLDSGWAQLWPAGGRKLQVATNEIKAPEELIWTFWISSDWKYYQFTVPSPCSPLATYYSYSFLTSRLQALLLTHHTSHKERQTCPESCREAGPQKSPVAVDSQAQGAWEAQRQWLITKWGSTGSMERV